MDDSIMTDDDFHDDGSLPGGVFVITWTLAFLCHFPNLLGGRAVS